MARTPQGGHKPLTPEQRAAREAKRARRIEEAPERAANRARRVRAHRPRWEPLASACEEPGMAMMFPLLLLAGSKR